MSLPRMNRVEFYRFQESDLVHALARAIQTHQVQHPAELFTAHHLAVITWSRLSIDVPNGGFTQFFYNHRGDDGVKPLADLLEELKVPKTGPVLRDAAAVYRRLRPCFVVENPFDGLFGSIKEFDKMDKVFMKIELRTTRALAGWIRANIANLALGENDEPIDPSFTGSVEIIQPNGLVSEYLEVKKGKPNGAHRQFFEDGSVRKVVFYKSGKVSGDYWPDGQLKKKESKRGPQKIFEWFYPGGQIQKRLIQNKDGYTIEPIRLYHKNGSIAEELTVSEGKKSGPWRKFFDDGSPKLDAEYASNETLIVHNAWSDDRCQIVTNGTGTFREDSHTIDWQYDVLLELGWVRQYQLRDGKPHGKVTTYSHGELWSVSSYVNGVQHGEEATYWKKGRVRSVTNYVDGRPGKSTCRPKFDNPVPAVIVSIEADEKLYTAWDHLRVDEYPLVLNLAEVQEQVTLPDFLKEVHQRNLDKTLKSDYEDCNTFDDGIAYFLTVNEAGEVTLAHANGSGVYSGGEWETYPPLLRKLRFKPGRIRGRAVECRVLACVDHTFIERS